MREPASASRVKRASMPANVSGSAAIARFSVLIARMPFRRVSNAFTTVPTPPSPSLPSTR